MEKKSHYIFRNLLRMNTMILVLIVLALELFFAVWLRQQSLSNFLDKNKKLCENAANYIKNAESTANIIRHNLYKSENELNDVLQYLKFPYEDYLKMRLYNYYKGLSGTYSGMEDFTFGSMELSENIIEIAYESYINENVITYTSAGGIKVNSGRDLFETIENGDIFVKDNKFTFQMEIRDPSSGESIGELLTSFSGDGLRQISQDYTGFGLYVFDFNQNIFFSSEQSSKVSLLKSADNTILSKTEMQRILDAYIETEEVRGIHIVSYISEQKAGALPWFIWVSLLAVGVILFFLGEMIVKLRLDQLEKRLGSILIAMEQLKDGDLDTRIKPYTTRRKDELDVIGENFNQMCEDLKMYIQKSYLAKLEQKSAEMRALQSQINPHFLYNTLEAIRMKAICSGDKDVGQMLYCLAVIFRSQIKENDLISIAKELHYCKKYMEIFEFRYQNKFQFEIECREELYEAPVIKFIIQPILENYFVHGIRLKECNNLLRIIVYERENIITIIVEDNGYGMSLDAIKQKNHDLDKDVDAGDSIGVINVQRRIRGRYGKKYGIIFEANEIRGLRVIMNFPKEESYVQGNAG